MPLSAHPEAHVQPKSASPPRRPLGDVSPNINLRQSSLPSGIMDGKRISGSPLKRSYTAVTDDGHGLRYLKRRKFSGDTPLSQVTTPSTGQSASLSPTLLHRDERSSSRQDAAVLSIPTIQHSVPTEPNTPTGSVHEDEENQSEPKSFSSLINYDPSSQPSTQQQASQQQPSQPKASQQQEPPPKSGLLFNGPSYAELLKLKLRVAMYKVRTNQINVPFQEIQVEETPTISPPTTNERSENTESDLSTSRSFPKLLPAPTLRPTSYSNRMIYGHSMPSSPPLRASPERQMSTVTPAKTSWRTASDEGELTSSIVKGRVAEGLLGLRNAV